ncbi:MAG: DNA repair protein RecN [Nakamurella sp.]
MLAELHISGLGVIDDAVIEPSPGLTVVTGETGAGKTMIVTALGLVCGGRADSGRVRVGAKRTAVEARFSAHRFGGGTGARTEYDEALGQHLASVVEAIGGDVDDDGSVLAVRSVSADGRSRAHIGGRAAPVAALTELTEPLVAVHGQADAMTLLKPANQRAVLDAYAGLGDELAAYRRGREKWLACRIQIDERTLSARDLAQREVLLKLGVDEIERADPKPGEDHDIATEVQRQGDADALREAATEALTALVGSLEIGAVGDEPSATGLVQGAIRLLEAASDSTLAARVGDLRSALAVIGDVGADLTGYLDGLDADPERLQKLLERQAVLRALVRKYGADVDAVLVWSRDAADELTGLDGSDTALEALRQQAAALGAAVIDAAAAIGKRRRAAAKKLSAAATAELAHLAMGTAKLRVAVTPLPEPGADGADHVEILLTAHGGAPEIPVARGASGGELSRIMLALEVVLAGADPVATLVFDEVDAGVGGRAATEIGSRLSTLARQHQVIVVTHLAQVAAFADTHYVVDADADGSVGASSVREVDGQDRLVELARMLGGTDGTAAMAHAADLRASAGSR